MTHFLIKTFLTALIVAAVSELGKRSSFAAAILVSLPLTSLLALTWLYLDSKDVRAVSELSMSIFWMVIPSLAFFPLLAILLRSMDFALAMAVACIGTALIYGGYVWTLGLFGVKF